MRLLKGIQLEPFLTFLVNDKNFPFWNIVPRVFLPTQDSRSVTSYDAYVTAAIYHTAGTLLDKDYRGSGVTIMVSKIDA